MISLFRCNYCSFGIDVTVASVSKSFNCLDVTIVVLKFLYLAIFLYLYLGLDVTIVVLKWIKSQEKVFGYNNRLDVTINIVVLK